MTLPEGTNVGAKHHPQDAPGENLVKGVLDWKPISGWTHNFYRYPARFSPRFAAAAIEQFSSPGELVLDPYMGGGTSIVEAIAAGRHGVGNDLNSLAAFVTRAKTTRLVRTEINAVQRWARTVVPQLSYHHSPRGLEDFIDPSKTRNLSLVRGRFIKKVMAAALQSLDELPSRNARRFVRCVLLRVGQWALDGRRCHTPLAAFRERLGRVTCEMLEAVESFGSHAEGVQGRSTILNMDTAALNQAEIFREQGRRVSLVVTSPPYPGVHVLYHRWQVDGRRETPAPYWISGCNDGKGASYYNFGGRWETAANDYFRISLLTLLAIREVMQAGAHMVQMIAFNRPDEQLPRYLQNMKWAGFTEIMVGGQERIWREVPNRKWHATLRGRTDSASEVLLIHRAA